jgi:hypothetical protein
LPTLVQQPLRRVVRLVRQHRRVPQEEWFVAARLDEVKDRLEPLAANLQSFVAVPPAALQIAVRHAGGEASLVIIPFPPFAALETDVPLVGQQLGKRRCAADVFEHQLPIGPLGRVVSGHLMLVRIKAGDDRHQARAAQAGRHVAAGEADSLTSQAIDVRRLDRRVPHETVIGPGLVVGDDQDDIRRPLRSLNHAARQARHDNCQTAARKEGHDGCSVVGSFEPLSAFAPRKPTLRVVPGIHTRQGTTKCCHCALESAALPVSPRLRGQRPLRNFT